MKNTFDILIVYSENLALTALSALLIQRWLRSFSPGSRLSIGMIALMVYVMLIWTNMTFSEPARSGVMGEPFSRQLANSLGLPAIVFLLVALWIHLGRVLGQLVVDRPNSEIVVLALAAALAAALLLMRRYATNEAVLLSIVISGSAIGFVLCVFWAAGKGSRLHAAMFAPLLFMLVLVPGKPWWCTHYWQWSEVSLENPCKWDVLFARGRCNRDEFLNDQYMSKMIKNGPVCFTALGVIDVNVLMKKGEFM